MEVFKWFASECKFKSLRRVEETINSLYLRIAASFALVYGRQLGALQDVHGERARLGEVGDVQLHLAGYAGRHLLLALLIIHLLIGLFPLGGFLVCPQNPLVVLELKLV